MDKRLILGGDGLQTVRHFAGHPNGRLAVRPDEACSQFPQDFVGDRPDVIHPVTVEARKK